MSSVGLGGLHLAKAIVAWNQGPKCHRYSLTTTTQNRSAALTPQPHSVQQAEAACYEGFA